MGENSQLGSVGERRGASWAMIWDIWSESDGAMAGTVDVINKEQGA